MTRSALADTTRFAQIRDKVRARVPLTHDDGVFLYRYPNLLALGGKAAMAGIIGKDAVGSDLKTKLDE